MAVYPELRQQQCVRYRYRYSECDRCQEACPHEAIVQGEDGVSVDGSKCQGCGLCVAACPTEALQLSALSNGDITGLAADRRQLSCACAPSGVGGDKVVSCLGALTPAILSSFVSKGVALELRGTGHCVQCVHAPKGADMLAMQFEGLDLLRKAAGDETWAEVQLRDETTQDVEPARGAHQAARRQMFRRLLGKGVDAIAKPQSDLAPAPLRAIRAAAPLRSERRDMLQNLWPHAAERPFSIPPHPSLQMAQLCLNEGCTLCEACARACPTGALRVEEDSSSWQLYFKAARCVGCAVCMEACQPGVLTPGDAINSRVLPENTVVLMHRVPRKRCSRCDRFFVGAGEESVCPICQSDDDDFTAIFG